MTTTPNPTAEPLKSWEVDNEAWEAFSAEEHLTNGIQAAYEAGLRAQSRLSEGTPSEEQIERACVAYESTNAFGPERETRMRAALTAAGVAPQEPCPQPCEHLSADDAREGRDCREHPCTCPTAPSSGREKLIEEARAVAGPKSLYAHTSVAHLLIRLADALVAAQGAAPQAEQATYLNVAHSSVLAGSINARRPAREVSAMQLIDAIYDPDEDDANDSVRYGYVLEQFERLRIIYADLDDPDAGPAPVLPSSGVDEDKLAEVERAAAARALEEAAVGIFVSPASADAVYDALRARAAEIRSDHGHG